jgi:hypothetical protein
MLCDAADVRRQRRRAVRFHLRRLETRSQAELDERAEFTRNEPVALAECVACGLISRARMPGNEAQRRAYADDTYADDRLVEMLAAQKALFRRKVSVLRRLLGGGRRILEVGSFVGGFLDVARSAGWDAIGVDPGRQLVERCRERGLRVFAGTLDEYAAHAGVTPVDCVAIWNTFDQLPDPRPTLALAARFAAPRGLLALRVPHGRCFRMLLDRLHAASPLRQRWWTACLAWNNLLSFPYAYGYGIDSLDRVVRPFGFERVAVRGDVLVTLAGRATAAWARAEEQLVKRAQLAWIRAGAARGSVEMAPWLDVYWRRV